MIDQVSYEMQAYIPLLLFLSVNDPHIYEYCYICVLIMFVYYYIRKPLGFEKVNVHVEQREVVMSFVSGHDVFCSATDGI